MTADLRFSPAVAPDVAIREGVVHLVFGPKPWTWLTLSLDGTLLDKRTQPVGYYPKTNGAVSLAHDGERFIRWTWPDGLDYPAGAPLGGMHDTGVSPSGLSFFYRKGDGVFTGTGAYCEGVARPNAYASYGLWECFDDGTCKTWDECYYVAKPAGAGQTHHSADGRVWVRECATGGIEGAVDGVPFLLWPGTTTMWPRCASDGMHAVLASWSGVGPTVRVWIGTLAELAAFGVAPAAPQTIAPFAEHFWAWCYKDDDGRAPKNVLTRSDGSMIAYGQIVGWNLAIEDDLPRVTATALACKAVKDAPVYAYLGSYVPETRIDGVDVPVLQAYRLPGCETSAAILAKLRTDLARCAYPRVALAVDLTARTLADGVPWSEQDRIVFLLGIAGLCREIRPAAVFAWAWNRHAPQAGISSSPVITEQWRRFVAAIPSTTGGGPHAMSEHLDTVRELRAQYATPLGLERAWRIVNAVAWRHRDEGWRLLEKSGGTRWVVGDTGYSIDVIVNPTTQEAVDCLVNSELEGTPSWQMVTWQADLAGRARPPLDPNTLLPAPDGSDLEARVRVLDAQVARILDWIGGF